MPAAPLKKPRYFATHAAMAEVQLAYGLSLSLADRLRELNRLNRIAEASAYGDAPRPRRKRLQLYFQQPGETLADFFARTEQARHAWTSSLKNSATL